MGWRQETVLEEKPDPKDDTGLGAEGGGCIGKQPWGWSTQESGFCAAQVVQLLSHGTPSWSPSVSSHSDGRLSELLPIHGSIAASKRRWKLSSKAVTL